MIQRIQTLYLLIALAADAGFYFAGQTESNAAVGAVKFAVYLAKSEILKSCKYPSMS